MGASLSVCLSVWFFSRENKGVSDEFGFGNTEFKVMWSDQQACKSEPQGKSQVKV